MNGVFFFFFFFWGGGVFYCEVEMIVLILATMTVLRGATIVIMIIKVCFALLMILPTFGGIVVCVMVQILTSCITT